MRTYVCNINVANDEESPLTLPTMKFDPPQPKPTKGNARHARYDAPQDLGESDEGPLSLPVYNFTRPTAPEK